MIFKRKILRKIYGPRFNQETNSSERRRNEVLQKLYNEPNILAFIRNKPTRVVWIHLESRSTFNKNSTRRKNKQNQAPREIKNQVDRYNNQRLERDRPECNL